MASTGQFRKDIEGLRALAVLAVLLFHLGVPGFSGGYIGVDVFFVISGYVITRGIVAEIESTGRFNFWLFYLKRIRRLLPALIVIVAASVFVGTMLFTPEHLQALGRSAVASILWLSNVDFWRGADYFDAESSTKPLLHTWSLSVEAQFYVVWPLLLAAVAALSKSKWRFPVTVIVVCALSFGLNALFVEAHDSIVATLPERVAGWFEETAPTIFYLTPFRMFELAMGAGLIWLERWHQPRGVGSDLGVLAGFGMIVWSVFTLYEGALFPYYNALPGCLGAALMIWCATGSRLRLLLAHPAPVYLGKISYSIYLVHWPLIVFYTYYVFRPINAGEMIALSVSTLVLATLMYHFIENPLRGRGVSNRRFVAAAAFAVVVVATPSYLAARDGWPDRVPGDIRHSLEEAGRLRSEVVEEWRKQGPGFSVAFADGDEPKIAFVGDSMSRDLIMTLHYMGLDDEVQLRRINVHHHCGVAIIDRTTLPDYQWSKEEAARCVRTVENAIANEAIPAADLVVVASRWYDWATEESIYDALAQIKANAKAPVLVMSRRVEFEPTVAQILARYGHQDGFAEYLFGMGNKNVEINARIKSAAQRLDLTYIDMATIQTDEEARKAPALSDDGTLLYWDWGHWSVIGYRYFGEKVASALGVRRLISEHASAPQ